MFFSIMIGCGDLKEETEADSSDNLTSKDLFTIPINYDFNNLK